MKIVFLLMALLKLTSSLGQSFSELVVYKRFHRAGTTIGLLNSFGKNSTGGVDTANINYPVIIDIYAWNGLLVRAKQKKHHQMKIGGVNWAGEMSYGEQKHYFVLCYPYVIIDLTARINYWLAEADRHSLDRQIIALQTQAK